MQVIAMMSSGFRRVLSGEHITASRASVLTLAHFKIFLVAKSQKLLVRARRPKPC